MKKYILLVMALIVIAGHSYGQCACCSGASIGASNGDYNTGVFNLPKKKFVIEGYGDYRTFTEGGSHEMEGMKMDSTDAHGAEEEETPLKSMFIGSLGLKYGITDKITTSVLMPYVFLNTDKGSANALGDMILLGTFGAYSRNNFNLAISAGVELPTGQQRASSFDNTTIVVGSGSFDPMLGVSLSKKWTSTMLQFNTLGKYTTNGYDNSNYGSLNVQNLMFSYQLKGQPLNCSPDSLLKNGLKWNVFVGYYGEWLGKIIEDGEEDANSGYYLGFATLGTAVSFRGFSIPVTFSMPFIQNLNGNQSDAGYRLRLGIVKRF